MKHPITHKLLSLLAAACLLLALLPTAALAAGFDGFVRLFSNDIAPVRLARDLGMAAVNRIAPLRRAFMHEAGGATGDLPRLLRGEAL